MKLLKGIRNFYGSHILILFISVFLVATLWVIASRSGIAFSVLTGLIYIASIYSVGWNCGDRDGRKIPGYYPSKAFPFLLAGFSAVIPLSLYALCFLCPNLWFVDVPFIRGELQFLFPGNYLQGTTDLIYKMWYFPLISFMGNAEPLLYAIPMILQSFLIVIGYFVGTTRFRMMDFFMQKFVFRKKKEQ